jgi:hypothetical protein
MPASLHEMSDEFRDLYESIQPYIEASKDASLERGIAMRAVKEAGLRKDHFKLILENLQKEPTTSADWKRGLDAMWRDAGLPDPVTDDLLERNVRTARDAVTSDRNGELPHEPDVEAEIPLPSAAPPENAYRERMLKRARKSADTPVN